MPYIDRLQARKTNIHSLSPIDEDESSTRGNLNILQNVLLGQFGLSKGMECLPLWRNGLRLLYGDQKTWANLWGIRRAGCDQQTVGYGQMSWLLPIPALFHLRMNYLKIIHNTHWEANARPSAPAEDEEEDTQEPQRKRRKTKKDEKESFMDSRSYLKDARDFWQRKDVGHQESMASGH